MSFEPIRLIEQTDVSDVERSLLRAGRAGAPVEYDVAAGAARLRAQLAALGAAGALATAAGAASRPGASAGVKALFAKVAFKIFLGLVVGAAFGGAGVVAGMHLAKTGTHVASVPSLPKGDVAPSAAPPGTAISSDGPVTLPPSMASASADVPAQHDPRRHPPVPDAPTLRGTGRRTCPAVRVHRSRPREGPGHRRSAPHALLSVANDATDAHATPQPPPTPTPPVETVQPPAPPPSDSLSEIRAVALARDLVERDPEDALSLLEKTRREHPAGYFVEEREALTVLALSRSGHTSAARQQGATFLRTYPKRPLLGSRSRRIGRAARNRTTSSNSGRWSRRRGALRRPARSSSTP